MEFARQRRMLAMYEAKLAPEDYVSDISSAISSVIVSQKFHMTSHSHFCALSRSFGRSPKLRRYLERRVPDLSFWSSISHLFMNRMSSTFSRSLFEQTAFQSSTESSCR